MWNMKDIGLLKLDQVFIVTSDLGSCKATGQLRSYPEPDDDVNEIYQFSFDSTIVCLDVQ